MIHKPQKKKLLHVPYNMVVSNFGRRNYGVWRDQNGLIWQFKGETILLNS
jgi:hypothetical protein